MRVRVKFFAALREVVGTESFDMDLPEGSKVSQLWGTLETRFADLKSHAGRVQVAVNQEYASTDMELRAADEVAFLPPVSGG